VNDPTTEKGDEASSNQALSEENQTKLKEVFLCCKEISRTKLEMLIVWKKYLNPLIKSFPAISRLLWSPSLIWTITMQQ
jgi:hypothetical protein